MPGRKAHTAAAPHKHAAALARWRAAPAGPQPIIDDEAGGGVRVPRPCGPRCRCEAPTGRTGRRSLPGGAMQPGARAPNKIGRRRPSAFPSVIGGPFAHSSLSKLVRELGIRAVPHGFRSSFRDWAAECSDAPREVCELALAHVNSDRVEAAYRRSDLFEKRRQLMERWAALLAGTSDNEARLSG